MSLRNSFASAWRYSWLLTLPLAAATLTWLLPVWRDTRQFVVYHPASMHRSSDVDLSLRQIALSRLAGLKTDLVSSWRSSWVTVTPALPTIDLYVPAEAQALLNAYLPKSGKETWVKAKARFPDAGLGRVDVRYRGDSLHHWGFDAKSWLIRAPKNEFIDGGRRWHVVLPRWRSVSNYYVNLRMAQKMGVLAPDPTLVSLRVNGRQHGGVHLLLPTENEDFLRNHGRLPGDFYNGDMSTMDDAYPQEQSIAGLWVLPWLWQKTVSDIKLPTDSHLPLEILFHRIYQGTPDELAEMLDLPAWARFAAYVQLFGASHMDMGHNWRLYYNPGKLSFEPVVGDGNGLPDQINEVAKDFPGLDLSVTTPLLARLHQDHEFLRLKNEALTRFFAAGLGETFFAELEGFVAKVAPTLDVYPQLDWIGTVNGDPVHYFSGQELRARAERVKPDLHRWFSAQRELASLRPENLRVCQLPEGALRLRIDGYAGVKISLPAADSKPQAAITTLGEDGHAETVDVSVYLVKEPAGRWLLDLSLLAEREISNPKIGGPEGKHAVRPATYDLKFTGPAVAPGDLELVGLMGERIHPVVVAIFAPNHFSRDNVRVVPAPLVPTQWSGTMEIQGLKEIKGDLVLAPGTRLRMGPDASLIIRGRLLASGTAGQPIVVERRDPATAWGTLAVIGPHADHTSLRFCRISGGSGRVTPFGIFSGMVSIYGAKDVTIEDCRFSRNLNFDSLFYSANSELVVRRSVFTDAFRAGIKLEICRASLEQVLIERTGGNGLDLVNSEVSVASSRLTSGSDKGLSAGERSRVDVFNSVIARNKTGVLAADGTAVSFYNCELADNQTQLAAYHRNGAALGQTMLTMAKSLLSGGNTAYALRDSATLALEDSQAPAFSTPAALRRDQFSDPSAQAKSALPAASYRALPGERLRTTARHDVRGLADPATVPNPISADQP